MRKYLLFTYYGYYPSGGWADFAGSFKTLEEARAAAATSRKDFWEIVDIDTEKVVEEGQ